MRTRKSLGHTPLWHCSWTHPALLAALIAAVALLSSQATVSAAAVGDITTVAGGYIGDGRPATNTALASPFDVAVDGQGNIFIADAGNDRIRKVDGATGIIETVAGDGNEGFSGDGGPAISASVNRPEGVAVDGQGNIFISDYFNHRIRRVDNATGVMDTIAGNENIGFSGDGGPATDASLAFPSGVATDGQGNIFIADTHKNRIRRVDGATGIITTIAGDGNRGFAGDGGPATDASLDSPEGVAVDSRGNVFIANRKHRRIRRVDSATGVIDTVAGNGERGFSGDGGPATGASLAYPVGVAVDGQGNLLIADSTNDRVRRVDATTGIITTVAGSGPTGLFGEGGFSGDGGPATSARLNGPAGVAVDGQGNIFIADTHKNRIRRVDAATGVINTVAGDGSWSFSGDGGPASAARLALPSGIAVDGRSNLFIADTENNRVRRVDATTGVIDIVAGNGERGFSGDGGPATDASLAYPLSVAVDGQGNLLIADSTNDRVRRVDATTGIITTVAGSGPTGLFGGGGFSGDGGPATSARLDGPSGLAVDGDGNIFIADRLNNRIRRVDAVTRIIETVAGDGNEGFSGDGGPATDASLFLPEGVALDGHGNIFIADAGNNRVRRVDAITGVIDTVAGDGKQGFSGDGGPAIGASLDFAIGVAVDGQGNLLIADSTNDRVRRVDAATGIIDTVAGNGNTGFSGDGGPATAATLNYPNGIAVDGRGNLFIADTHNNRIRMVEEVAGPSAAPAAPRRVATLTPTPSAAPAAPRRVATLTPTPSAAPAAPRRVATLTPTPSAAPAAPAPTLVPTPAAVVSAPQQKTPPSAGGMCGSNAGDGPLTAGLGNLLLLLAPLAFIAGRKRLRTGCPVGQSNWLRQDG